VDSTRKTTMANANQPKNVVGSFIFYSPFCRCPDPN
jgi:hypothetical protein